ncbi:PD40 domain-containing protein [bacterium]|nr:PD40 domain-containing protein [bacterium]
MKKIFLFYFFVNLTSILAQAPVRLTDGSTPFLQPVWSPAGDWIALTTSKYDGIWLIKPDGSELHQLTDDLAVGYKMCWSSDGKFLVGRAVQMQNRRRWHVVKIYDTVTKTSKAISEPRKQMPSLPQWLDNERVALFLDNKPAVFKAVAANDRALRLFNNRALVFMTQNGLSLTTAAGETTKIPLRPSGQIINAELSPGGDRIVYEELGSQLFSCALDGSEIRSLGRGERPHWSPEGKYIAFMQSEDDGHRILRADIYVMNHDGMNRLNLTNSAGRLEMNCSWSPDGQRLVFDDRTDGVIWVMPFTTP